MSGAGRIEATSAERAIAEAENFFEWIELVARKYVNEAPLEKRERWLQWCSRVADHASGRSAAEQRDRDRLLPEFID